VSKSTYDRSVEILPHKIHANTSMMNTVDHDDSASMMEIQLLVFIVEILNWQLEELVEGLESILLMHIREQQRLNRALPQEKCRPTWEAFSSRIPSIHFRRMFRMTLESFSILCKNICKKVGEDKFRSEEFIANQGQGLDAKIPLIPGEIKVAISIRMLAGGSYLDLVPLFEVSTSHLYNIFHTFLAWVLKSFEFPLVPWLRERNWSAINHLANIYAEKSNGIFFGAFSAIDGLAVRVKSPTEREVADPGNYYCRKGFYALNVQAICDKSKQFLWCYPSNKGSTHDSVAFTSSKLFELLKEVSEDLYERGLFIVGDSAYNLTSFLVTPYDTDEVGSDSDHSKDSFNYHLSSCRIYIECAFGELVMRWGIFWRTLLFDLKKSANIVQVTMLLHNFIIDCREKDPTYFEQFDIPADDTQDYITEQTGEVPQAIATDNNEPRTPGRRTLEENKQRERGISIRDRLTVQLAVHNMKRPMEHGMHYNSHGHIYMSS
jgi:DDE superfamily endonuclease